MNNCIVPPKITPFEFARDVNVGDRVSVQCVVGTGDLPLTFRWLRDDVTITPSNIDKNTKKTLASNDLESPITIRQNDEFTSALSISAISRNQGGTYKCIVENDAAKETYSALLRVNGKKLNESQQTIDFLLEILFIHIRITLKHVHVTIKCILLTTYIV